jgi:hypothetical protein
MNLPPAQRGPRHYVITDGRSVVAIKGPGQRKFRTYHTRAEALDLLSGENAQRGLQIVDVGSPGPELLGRRFRK